MGSGGVGVFLDSGNVEMTEILTLTLLANLGMYWFIGEPIFRLPDTHPLGVCEVSDGVEVCPYDEVVIGGGVK